jgi:hypothetical protein
LNGIYHLIDLLARKAEEFGGLFHGRFVWWRSLAVRRVQRVK